MSAPPARWRRARRALAILALVALAASLVASGAHRYKLSKPRAAAAAAAAVATTFGKPSHTSAGSTDGTATAGRRRRDVRYHLYDPALFHMYRHCEVASVRQMNLFKVGGAG